LECSRGSGYADAALIENGPFGRLKDDVVAGIALVELVLDFFGEVVLLVLGFPIAVRQVIEIDESAVHSDRAVSSLDQVLGDEGQLWLGSLTALGQQSLKGAADRALVVNVELTELAESLVVGLDGGVRRLERERHTSGGEGTVYNGMGALRVCKSGVCRGRQ